MSVFRDLVRMGYSCIPVLADGTKRPVFPWKEMQRRLPDNDDLCRFESYAKPHGVAVVCGQVSCNLECLDFDNPLFFARWRDKLDRDLFFDGEGERILREIDRPDSPYFYLEQTPSGGFHLLYRCTSRRPGNQKLASDEEGNVCIETRGEGGYVIIAPTEGYRPLFRPLRDMLSLQERDVEIMRRYAVKLNEKRTVGQHLDFRRLSRQRDPALFTEAYSALLGAGWSYCGTYEDKVKLTRPGKRNRAVSALWSHERGTLYVFSTNAQPFEANHLYYSDQIIHLLKGDKHE